MTPKTPKTDYQKRKERKAAKEKAATEAQMLSDYETLKNRHEAAMDTHRRISLYAHGRRPQQMSMPAEVTGPLGGQFTTDYELPTGNEEATTISLANMLQYKNEGVSTGDPASLVRRHWETPPPLPSSSGGFMGHTRANRKTTASDLALATGATARLSELKTKAPFEKFRTETGITENTSIPDIFEGMVSTRKSKFNEGNSVDWYEGEQVGTTPEGFPQYAEGESPKILREMAAESNLSETQLRRSAAMASPQATWSVEKDGKMQYPNAEAARQGMVKGRDTSRTPADIGKEVGSAIGHGVLPSNIEKTVRQSRGELSQPWEPITPPPSNAGGIATAKQSNFDLGLSNPYSKDGVYSPLVAYEKSTAYTSDTHDLGVAGVKTGSIPHISEKTGKPIIDPKSGKPKKHNPAEAWLSGVGGQDLSIASAHVALADLFNEHYGTVHAKHGKEVADKWAEAHAHQYTPNKAQSTLWVSERED